MLRALLLLLTAAFLPSQNANPRLPDSTLSPYDVTEAYEVYSALIPDESLVKPNAGTVLIRAATEPHEMCLKPEDDAEGRLVKFAMEDYDKENGPRWLLQRKFTLDRPYDLLYADDFASWSREAGLAPRDGFRARYPDARGWMVFSAVGFSQEKTIAVVYVGHHYGNGGSGGFAVLRKEAGKWTPMKFRGLSCFRAS
jgi:hypothetical protein